MKHGSATRVGVEVACDCGVVDIRVFDNGRGETQLVQPGLGSRMLDEMCMSWTRTRSTAGTAVHARLAV